MTKKETLLAAMRSTEFYADCFKSFAAYDAAHVALVESIRFSILSGIKGAYNTALQAGMDYFAAEYSAPRQKVLDIMKKAGIKAPGKNGKRGAKTVEPVAATLEAWVACFHTADKKTAAKIAKQLGW